jgi:type I restriction enzyme S subunit
MTEIFSLLSALCPNGVNFLSLGDCIEENLGGGTPSKSDSANWGGDIPWASVGDLSIPGSTIESTRNSITRAALQTSSTRIVPAGWLIVAVKISPGHMKIAGLDVAINQDLRGLKVRDFMSPKFVYYFFQTLDVLGNGTIVQGITKQVLEAIRVPVPPMEVQLEIVRILDAMTSLQAELQAELEARRKQYEYYRDTLLNFAAPGTPPVRWMTLGEVLRIRNGRDYKHLGEGSVPVYGSGGVMTAVTTPIYEAPSVLIPRKGSLGKLYYLESPFWTVDTIFYTEIDESLVRPKFVYYYLSTCHLEELNEAGGVPSLTQTVLNKQHFPVPSLSEQQRIVDVLDRFESLTTDISFGLPAEIEARRKQYEYYRDRLLTFEELVA